jgi:hypothetical protein
MLGGRQMIAIEDANVITRQPRRTPRRQSIDNRLGLQCRMFHQSRRQAEFHAIKLVVNGLVRNLERVASLSIRRIDRGLDAQDHTVHQFDERREQQRALVLSLCCPLEQLVEPFGLEELSQNRMGHDANRASFDERLKNAG